LLNNTNRGKKTSQQLRRRAKRKFSKRRLQN
jgi:hypothetical protein